MTKVRAEESSSNKQGKGEKRKAADDGEDDQSQDEDEQTVVILGAHSVPKGVVVFEPLENYAGQWRLQTKCPQAVHDMMADKGLLQVYQAFVDAVCSHKAKTRKSLLLSLHKWNDHALVNMIHQFQDEFQKKGLKVVLCKRSFVHSDKPTYRWLEYIDLDITKSKQQYVPPFDYANRSAQMIPTHACKIHFPNGVAIQEISSWRHRRKLVSNIPVEVQQMLEQHNVKEAYRRLLQEMTELHPSDNYKSASERHNSPRDWNLKELSQMIQQQDKVQSKFRSKSISILLASKNEWVQHGERGGHSELYIWIEVIDRTLQPNYESQQWKDQGGFAPQAYHVAEQQAGGRRRRSSIIQLLER